MKKNLQKKYIQSAGSGEIDTVRISRNLQSSWDIEYIDETDSTNEELKRRASCGLKRKTILIAGRQSAGKGRLGRSFFSDNAGIYMTMFLPSPGVRTAMLTVRAAVAVACAITARTGKKAGIKWVNDIFLDDRKVCGILAESRLPDFAIVGIGINTGTCKFPDEIQSIAGSIGEVDKELLISDIVNGFETEKEYIKKYRRLSCILGREVEITGKNMCGIATEILDNGNLVVKLPDGSGIILNSGEISIKMK